MRRKNKRLMMVILDKGDNRGKWRLRLDKTAQMYWSRLVKILADGAGGVAGDYAIVGISFNKLAMGTIIEQIS